MKLKINKACDLGSISVLPPRFVKSSSLNSIPSHRSISARFVTLICSSRTGGSGGGGASGSSAAAAVGSQPQQHRSQTLSQQSFSQGGGGSGGGSSLLQSQSQLSQGSLDENHLALHLLSPPRDQVCNSSIPPPDLPVVPVHGGDS